MGEIIDIDIQGPDNGSVVLGEITPTYFVFQTIDTPTSGSHPEYGSREFGFQRNGSVVTFYTRGVSRPGSYVIGLVGAEPQRKGWTGLLRGIAGEINARGGQADFASFASTREKLNN